MLAIVSQTAVPNSLIFLNRFFKSPCFLKFNSFQNSTGNAGHFSLLLLLLHFVECKHTMKKHLALPCIYFTVNR